MEEFNENLLVARKTIAEMTKHLTPEQAGQILSSFEVAYNMGTIGKQRECQTRVDNAALMMYLLLVELEHMMLTFAGVSPESSRTMSIVSRKIKETETAPPAGVVSLMLIERAGEFTPEHLRTIY